MTPSSIALRAAVLVAIACTPSIADDAPATLVLDSPDARLRATFRLDAEGRPGVEFSSRGKPIARAGLGLDLADGGPLRDHLKLVASRRSSVDELYAIPVGKTSSARDRHNELTVDLEETVPPHRKLQLAFRAFDDGLAFRYQIPESAGAFTLLDELTELEFPGDPAARVLPLKNHTTSYEAYYETLRTSAVGPDRLLALPILLGPWDEPNEPHPTWLAVTEADLTDYAGMYLSGVAGAPGVLASKLSPLPGRKDRAKVVGKGPHPSPWRILMVADDPGRLLESNIVFHLSAPIAIKDASWIKPGKTTFPWWNGYATKHPGLKAGVNTATMKYYIDFCAENHIPYHSLDGLDIAWYGGPIDPQGPTDVTKAAPSIDMPELLRYAKEKGVRLRLWVHWKALKPQIDDAFRTYESWGIEGVMVDFMDRDDQEMVRFYHEMASKAAKHHLTLNLHGAYKPTGMERAWPNVLNYEAALNQEYNKWEDPSGRGTPPAHNLDIAFVRMLAGPLDYHQGGMRSLLPESYKPRNLSPPVQGTRGHQLAMYVVYQNHLPMMADDPDAYRGQPGLEFMVDVPTNWDETRVLVAEPGRCLVVARRKGADWYLGGMTAPEARDLALPLGFLSKGKGKGKDEGASFVADLLLDRPADGPVALDSRRQTVSASESLRVAVPRGGGFVARIRPATR